MCVCMPLIFLTFCLTGCTKWCNQKPWRAYLFYLTSAIKGTMLFAAAGLSAMFKEELMHTVAILPSFKETLFGNKVAGDVKVCSRYTK